MKREKCSGTFRASIIHEVLNVSRRGTFHSDIFQHDLLDYLLDDARWMRINSPNLQYMRQPGKAEVKVHPGQH